MVGVGAVAAPHPEELFPEALTAQAYAVAATSAPVVSRSLAPADVAILLACTVGAVCLRCSHMMLEAERAAAAALQLAQAGKRCSPSDPDKSRPKVPSLPWWDDLRFLWRGSIHLSAM